MESPDEEKRPSTASVQDERKVDAALQYLLHEETTAMTDIDEKKLVRKIDRMIVPLMWCCYNLQYLDKTLINYAAVMDLDEDAHITTSQFSTLALIFYVTYLAFELPTGYLMQRLPLARYLGCNVICWGTCIATTAACKNYGSLVAVRTLLGCFESAVAPSLILITTMWYKKHEQPLRIGIWYVGIGTGTIIGALASFGFQHYKSTKFYSWQIMFLLIGLITILIGILVFFLLPNNPMSSRLSREEKIWAIERLRENQTGIENKHFKFHQAIECFKDPQTYLLILITLTSNIPNGAVSSYQATIIKGFGYNSEQTALLNIPSGAVSVVSIVGATWCAGRYGARAWNIVILLLLGCLGGCLMAFLPQGMETGKLIGDYLTNCIGASLPLIYSWVSANYAGHTKKVTMNAVLLMSFCLGNIIGPLTFRSNDAPNYIPAKITIVVVSAVAAALTVVLRFMYQMENRRRDRRGVGLEHRENQEFMDMTDRENGEFRYQL